MMIGYLDLYREFDLPFDSFDNALLGEAFPHELAATSRLWFGCGYRPGIAAYLSFFLLKDFILLHDSAAPPRFQSLRSMADSFYRTDVFVREVTDSGKIPSGGISSSKVRDMLQALMRRHQRLSIPDWMMSCFGFSLLEMVEKQCAAVSSEERQLHLSYMSKAFRIMGIPFSRRRDLLERFSRAIEEAHAGLSPNAEKHTRNILLLAEMVGVSSERKNLASMLPAKTRAVFEDIYEKSRPAAVRRLGARLLGRLLIKQAIGPPRIAVPSSE